MTSMEDSMKGGFNEISLIVNFKTWFVLRNQF